jgi:hypothetical protein
MPQLDNIELFEELLILSLYFIINTTLINILFIGSDFIVYLNIYWFFFLCFLGLDYLLKIFYIFNNFKILQILTIKNNIYLRQIQIKKDLNLITNINFFNFFFNKYENFIYINTHNIIKTFNSIYFLNSIK